MSSAPIPPCPESDCRAGVINKLDSKQWGPQNAIACCLHRRYVSSFNVSFEIPGERSRRCLSSDDCQFLFFSFWFCDQYTSSILPLYF